MKHFLAISDYSRDELHGLLRLAQELKGKQNEPLLQDRVLAMVFQKPSLRTRVSFDMAMRRLGGDALYLSPNEIGLGVRESIADVSRVLSGYVDIIMARVFDHQHILDLAEYARVPVINGLSDYNHPCQALADVLTILERFGSLEGLNVTYVGDGNNVALSLLYACAILGMNYTIASPDGYELSTQVISQAEKLAMEGVEIRQLREPQEAVSGAHVVYTDTWVSMGQEEEAKRREEIFPPYQVNNELIANAEDSVIVLHCLPAHRGHEIMDDVMDGPRSAVFEQAENRMHAQKAILVHLLS